MHLEGTSLAKTSTSPSLLYNTHLVLSNSWDCSSFPTDQVTLWLIATLIPDTCMVEAAVLSNLAQVFGLLDSVKKILERRRQQTDPNQGQVLSTLTSEYTLYAL